MLSPSTGSLMDLLFIAHHKSFEAVHKARPVTYTLAQSTQPIQTHAVATRHHA